MNFQYRVGIVKDIYTTGYKAYYLNYRRESRKGLTMIEYKEIASYENERYSLVLVEVWEHSYIKYYAMTGKDNETGKRVDYTGTWRDSMVDDFNRIAAAMGRVM